MGFETYLIPPAILSISGRSLRLTAQSGGPTASGVWTDRVGMWSAAPVLQVGVSRSVAQRGSAGGGGVLMSRLPIFGSLDVHAAQVASV